MFNISSYLEFSNESGPNIRVSGLYVASALHEMDPDKNYVGTVILGVRDQQKWYTDGSSDLYT